MKSSAYIVCKEKNKKTGLTESNFSRSEARKNIKLNSQQTLECLQDATAAQI